MKLCRLIAIFTVKKYKMSMKYGCCGSADSGEGRRVEVADKNPEDYPYTAVLDIKGMTCENCVKLCCIIPGRFQCHYFYQLFQ